MTSSDLDLRLMRFRSRGDEPPQLLASALIEAGRSHDALEVIHLGLLGNEEDADLVTLEGRALYEQGELNEAQSALVRAAKANPENKEAYRWLAQVLIERGDPARAVQVLERALAIDAGDANLRKALTRAQRLVEREGTRRASPSSAPPPASPRASSEAGRIGSARSAPAAKAPARPANQNVLTSMALGRGSRGQEALASDLAREHDPRSAPQGAHGTARALLFEEEVERDDESPTTAVEVPEEVRSWLRGEGAREATAAPRGLATDDRDDDDDEDSEPTSIVPAAEELELLRYQAAMAEAEPGDRTIVDRSHPLDQAALARPGEAEPPEQVLALLERQGVYEPRPTQPGAWASGSEVQRPGARVTRALGLAWLFALLAAVGGYYGFDAWLASRRARAHELVVRAEAALFDGQYESLLAAERDLLEARALDPKSAAGLDALLFVQTARALDGAAEEFGPVRDTLGRAQQAGLTTQVVAAAAALARPGPLDASAAQQVVEQIERGANADPLASYLGARLAERAGLHERATQLLQRAATREPRLALAALGAGEQARGQGQLDVARTRFEQALGSDRKQLRAELWLALLGTSPLDSKELSRKLDGLRERIARGSPAEQLVAAAVRAYALSGAADLTGARAVLRGAANLRTGAPEPLALYAEQALRAGESALAQRAVRAAHEAGGGAPRYQTLLAAALLQQGAGDAAISALGDAGGTGERAGAHARAHAALLTDAREALQQAKRELAAHRATPEGKGDDEAAALLMRVDMRLGGSAESLLPAARTLAQRVPDQASAHLALADAAVRAERASEALSALEPALRLAPGSADVHALMGAAQRLAGRPSEARASLERAIAIAPTHLEARRWLARMLLDGGEYDAALALYRGLEASGGAAARLGTIEASLAKGNLEEARAQLATLGEGASTPAAISLRAKLEQRRGNPAAAVELLAPLVDEDAESRSADLLALYGDALYAAGKVDPASRAYDDALELEPTQLDALLGRATVALHANRSDQALTLAQRAQTEVARRAHTTKVEARALMLAGRALLGKGQLGGSREALAKAAALPDAPAEAHFWYGETLVRLHDPSAVQHYTKYVQLEPTGPFVARARRALAVR